MAKFDVQGEKKEDDTGLLNKGCDGKKGAWRPDFWAIVLPFASLWLRSCQGASPRPHPGWQEGKQRAASSFLRGTPGRTQTWTESAGRATRARKVSIELSIKNFLQRSCRGAVEANLTRHHEVMGSIPGLTQWVKDLVLP